MNLGPEVSDAVDARQTNINRQKTVIIAILAAMIAVSLVVIIAGLIFGSSTSNGYVWRQFNHNDTLALVIGLPIAFVGALLIAYYLLRLGAREKKYCASFEKDILTKEDSHRLLRFRSGLEAASKDLAMRHPHVKVLDIPHAGFVGFLEDDGSTTIAISQRVIEADLTEPEVDSLMADEASRAFLGDVIKPRTLEAAAWFTLVPFAFLGAIAVVMSIRQTGNRWAALLPALLYLLAALCLFVAFIFALRKLSAVRRDDEILADSIAVKITGDAGVLKNAVLKLDRLDLLGRITPRINFKKPVLAAENAGKPDEAESSDEFVVDTANQRAELRPRLENLDGIAHGHWKCFEVVGGGEVVAEPEGWE